MTKMTELEEIVWTECVERLMPPDDETRQRWESDPFVMHQEHFRIRPLPPQHNKLLRAAHQEWVDEEHFALKRLCMTESEFANRFPVLREGFLAGDEESMRAGATYGMAVQGVVPNMDMVNCFASFLPRALSYRCKEQAEFGKRVAAMFYLEQMYKAQQSGMDYAALGLKRADALWRFASFLCD